MIHPANLNALSIDVVHLGDIEPCTMVSIVTKKLRPFKDEVKSLTTSNVALRSGDELIPGQSYILDVLVDQTVDFESFQAQFSVNPDVIQNLVVECPVVDDFHSESEPGYHLSDNKLRLVFVNKEGGTNTCTQGAVLFRLGFDALEYVQDFREVINFENDEMFESLIETESEMGELQVTFLLNNSSNQNGNKSTTPDLEVYPNPVSSEINLVFESSADEVALITIYDLANNVVHLEKVPVSTGVNHVRLAKDIATLMPRMTLGHVEVVTHNKVLIKKFAIK